jgi:hypothetical protein
MLFPLRMLLAAVNVPRDMLMMKGDDIDPILVRKG